ncbi:MAG: PEP-CTERM sorting domain-containing protein [Planctomycetota bacterium]
MRKFIAAMMCLGLVASVASAGQLQLYFSTTGAGDVVPPEYAAQINPELPMGGGTAYLWAFVNTGNIWNGLALESHGALATAGEMYNDALPILGGIRWEPAPASDLDPVGDNYIFGFSVTRMGLGSSMEAVADANFGWDKYIPGTGGGHYLVAEYTYDGSAPVFLAPGLGGISLSGSNPGANDVYFGFGDAPVPDNAVGQMSDIADLTFIPEPASLLLLGLAGLVLRRR